MFPRRASTIAVFMLATNAFVSVAVGDPDNAWEWPDQGIGTYGTGVWDLVVWDGEGVPALYVGGDVHFAGGIPATGIARWDGEKWSPFGGEGTGGGVLTMCPFDAFGGPALYVGGGFHTAGGKPAEGIARYQGGEWYALGEGLNTAPSTLLGFDDGTGPSLYVGGGFWYNGTGTKALSHIARWDGQEWHSVGGGTSGVVMALAVFDDGGGPALFVGGQFFGAGGKLVNNIAKWNGVAWSELAGGVTGAQLGSGWVTAMTTFDDGSGPRLFVGGTFTKAGQIPTNGLATWDGKSWAAADQGFPTEYPAQVADFTVFDGGTGPVLYSVGGNNVVRQWNGSGWTPLDMSGVAFGSIYTIAGFKDSTGAKLHLAGNKLIVNGAWTNIARQTKTIGGGTPCGDLTGDGFVDQQDLGLLLSDFGCTKGLGLCPGDCDNDGDTDQADLGILLANWEKPCP